MKPKHAARVIHPRAPWAIPGSKVPAPVPQQPAQPPQQPAQPPKPGTLSIGPARPSARSQAHLDAAKDTRLVDPPRVVASAPTVSIYLDGARVAIPAEWSIAFSSSGGKDTIYALEPRGVLHVLTLDSQGRLRELAGLSAELIDDLIRWRFPRFRR